MSNNKLYLSEILKVDEINVLEMANEKNILVIAPCGCGKSTFIKKDLFTDKTKKYLVLVDNTGVKMQTMKDGDICNSKDEILVKNEKGKYELTKEYFDKKNITCMCYAEFGKKVKYDVSNEFIQSFDIIVCDEIHNLINYQQIDDSTELNQTFTRLLEKYNDTKIIWMTATPHYLDELVKNYPQIDKHFNTIDYSKDKRIMKYINKRKTYLSHFSSITTELRQYEEFFKYANGKVLIYTRNISTMKSIQESLEQLDFIRPICIWSDNNKINKLSDEQIKVRDYLIDEGKLLEPYNCLIINKAYETGLNIYDANIQIMVAHTTNATEQEQARGRIRHDIDLLVLRTNDKKLIEGSKVQIDESLLNKKLDKTDLQIFVINKFGLTDDKGRKMTVNKLLTDIEKFGYSIDKVTERDKEYYARTKKSKNVTKYIITKINQ